MGNAVTLHSACASGDLVGLKGLLSASDHVDLESLDDCGRTPLLVAVAAMKVRRDSDDFSAFGMADSGVSDQEDEEDGEEAALDPRDTGDDADDEAEADEPGEGGNNASVEPISKGAEILHLLLQKQVNVDHQDEDGRTALHHACMVQSVVAVKMLVHAGARPMRDSYGLLPQDFMLRSGLPDWAEQVIELKELLDEITEQSPYSIKLLAFRPSGIVQLNMGAQVEKGCFVTIEFDAPEKHSPKDYIQVLISPEDSNEIEMGSNHQIPAEPHGQITISTDQIPATSTVRFVYIKTDINKMSRKVVASGCNAIVQASVGEIFQFELYLYERVVEVESIPDFEFIDQPLIILKRIGIVIDETEIDWVDIRPGNHIVAVNGIRIDTMTFSDAVHVLQENNGKMCTKLLMQNYSACGDFIPEKILGVGVVGKYAFLQPTERDEPDDSEFVTESSIDEFSSSEIQVTTGEATTPEAVNEEPRSDEPAPTTITYQKDWVATPGQPAVPVELPLADDTCSTEDVAAVLVDLPKLAIDISDDPASTDSVDAKISAASTIETVMPLENSRQLVEQLQVGITNAVQ